MEFQAAIGLDLGAKEHNRFKPFGLALMVAILIRILERLFLFGAIVCAAAVIPITAIRLFGVLFESVTADEDRPPPAYQRDQQS